MHRFQCKIGGARRYFPVNRSDTRLLSSKGRGHARPCVGRLMPRAVPAPRPARTFFAKDAQLARKLRASCPSAPASTLALHCRSGAPDAGLPGPAPARARRRHGLLASVSRRLIVEDDTGLLAVIWALPEIARDPEISGIVGPARKAALNVAGDVQNIVPKLLLGHPSEEPPVPGKHHPLVRHRNRSEPRRECRRYWPARHRGVAAPKSPSGSSRATSRSSSRRAATAGRRSRL